MSATAQLLARIKTAPNQRLKIKSRRISAYWDRVKDRYLTDAEAEKLGFPVGWQEYGN